MLDYINGLKLPDMKIPEFDWAKDHRRRSFCLGPPSHLSKDIKAIQIGIHPKLCCKGLHNLTFRTGSPYKESDHVLHQEGSRIQVRRSQAICYGVHESKCAKFEARQRGIGIDLKGGASISMRKYGISAGPLSCIWCNAVHAWLITCISCIGLLARWKLACELAGWALK